MKRAYLLAEDWKQHDVAKLDVRAFALQRDAALDDFNIGRNILQQPVHPQLNGSLTHNDADVIDRMMRNGDCWAISDFQGFKKPVNTNVSW